jgi:hypothetical protein
MEAYGGLAFWPRRTPLDTGTLPIIMADERIGHPLLA